MIPIVTPQEMAAIDAAAPDPVDVLIGRAGSAVAAVALDLLGGAYGRRVVVLAGKGNNGNDGRAAARILARRGVRVTEVDAADLPRVVPACDLVIDAAYGTGFRGHYDAPEVGTVPVLAVDIPSGLSGATGEVSGRALPADVTVTFAALKPGLLFGDGRASVGRIVVADIGLDTGPVRSGLVERDDVAAWLPPRATDRHKWKAGVLVVAGSPGMSGAARLVAGAALRSGAGMVRVGSPGSADPDRPVEAVGLALPADGWADVVVEQEERFQALVIGPGLGRSVEARAGVRSLLERTTLPAVVDGDGLAALGLDAATVLAGGEVPCVLTPHDGEYRLLTGGVPQPDRLAAAFALAEATGAVVLLKGAVSVVASPDGETRVVAEGDDRLATPGTGDVLSGIIGALLADGLPAVDAAAAGAWLHGRAARHGDRVGLVAGDLLDLLPAAMADARG
jgi:NAD(P)H-hydrate epimerase